MRAVAVTSSFPPAALGEAHLVVDALSSLTLEALDALCEKVAGRCSASSGCGWGARCGRRASVALPRTRMACSGLGPRRILAAIAAFFSAARVTDSRLLCWKRVMEAVAIPMAPGVDSLNVGTRYGSSDGTRWSRISNSHISRSQ
jgi:hypothetical protein